MKKIASVETFPTKSSTERMLEMLISFRERKDNGETTDNQLEDLFDELDAYLHASHLAPSHDDEAIVADPKEVTELKAKSDDKVDDPSTVEGTCAEIEKSLGMENAEEETDLLERLTAIHEELENVRAAIENIANDLQVTSKPKSSLEKIVEDIAESIEAHSGDPRDILFEVKDMLDLVVLPADDIVLRKKVEAMRDGIAHYWAFNEVDSENFYNSVAPMIKWS